ncbi:hypothetical protein P8452_38102 [Trifolium repens]|nr:hypothetical protein P8452_38102 [Trifolium repens]
MFHHIYSGCILLTTERLHQVSSELTKTDIQHLLQKVSQSDPYLQSFISRRPHVRTQHLRVATTHANSSSSNFFQESFVVLVRLKSILLGPLCLRNSETLVD